MASSKHSAFSVGRVVAIASNTFREALRSRVVIGLMVVAMALILSSLALSEMTIVGQGPRVVLDFGFFAISLFSAVTAIAMGALLLHKEVDKKTIYTIVSKPVHRYEFVLGKYKGMLAILLLELLVLTAVWLLVLMIKEAPITLELFKGVALIYFELILVAAVATMFSAISSPVMTAVFSSGVFFVGRSIYLLAEMLGAKSGIFVKNEWLRPFGEATVAVFPDLSVFNISQAVLLDVETSWSYLGASLGYAATYALVLLIIAMFAFQRRDFV